MVSDIFNKPKIKLFPDKAGDEFYRLCKTRESQIKDAIKICTRSFNSYVLLFNGNDRNLNKWEREKAKSCAKNLGEYLSHLLEELDKDKIEAYCLNAQQTTLPFIPFMADMILLMINSFQGAIKTDLHWVADLTLADSIDISIDDFDFTKLDRYLPARIRAIEQLVVELNEIDYVELRADSIREAIQCHHAGSQKASNLLLLTLIEGLVRSLGIRLVPHQGLQVDPFNKYKYASLDKFLQIPWKKDIQISNIKYGLLTGNYTSYKNDQPDTVHTNLTERLGFLTRRFKENRNVILHGEKTDYANSLNSFLNFTALYEVLLTIHYYKGLYH